MRDFKEGSEAFQEEEMAALERSRAEEMDAVHSAHAAALEEAVALGKKHTSQAEEILQTVRQQFKTDIEESRREAGPCLFISCFRVRL